MDTMPEFPDWERPYFSQPADPNLLYFVVYGNVVADFDIPGIPYRVLYQPPALQLNQYNASNQGEEKLNQFRRAPFVQNLKEQHPELQEKVNEQNNCYIVQYLGEDNHTLNDLRVAIGIVTYLLDNGCVAVFDLIAHKWWTPEEWREQIFMPQEFSAFEHVTINAVKQDDATLWYITQGMRKFGRPDLSIHKVTPENQQFVQDMFMRFIAYMAQGGNIAQNQEIRMKGLPRGMFCERAENLEDPVFNNRHVEIQWPS